MRFSALWSSFAAELGRVADLDQAAETRGAPPGHVCGDPVADRHVVETGAGGVVMVVERRVAGGVQVALERRADLRDVESSLVVGVDRAVEVERLPGPGRLGRVDVVEPQAQLRGERADVRVAGVDELAPVLRDLPLREDVADRPAASAEPLVRLVDLRVHALLAELARTGQAGKARAHDRDALGRAAGGRRARRLIAAAAHGPERAGGKAAPAEARSASRRVVRASSANRSARWARAGVRATPRAYA